VVCAHITVYIRSSVEGTTRRPYYIMWHINNGSDCIHIKFILYFFASKIIIIRKIMKNYAKEGQRERVGTRLLEIKVSN